MLKCCLSFNCSMQQADVLFDICIHIYKRLDVEQLLCMFVYVCVCLFVCVCVFLCVYV